MPMYYDTTFDSWPLVLNSFGSKYDFAEVSSDGEIKILKNREVTIACPGSQIVGVNGPVTYGKLKCVGDNKFEFQNEASKLFYNFKCQKVIYLVFNIN
jgi:hypothetical protein